MFGLLRRLFGRSDMFCWHDGQRNRSLSIEAIAERIREDCPGKELSRIISDLADGKETDARIALWELSRLSRKVFEISSPVDPGKQGVMSNGQVVDLFFFFLNSVTKHQPAIALSILNRHDANLSKVSGD